MYYDLAYNVRYYLPVLAFIFFIILLFDKKSRYHSFVILSICILCYLMPDLDTTKSRDEYTKDFLNAAYTVIAYNVAAMLALMYKKDKPSKRQALVFACVIFLHIVVSLKVINGFYWWNYHLVTFYNEILIALALYQLWVSKDGLIRIYNGIQIYDSWYWLIRRVRLQPITRLVTRPQKEEGRT